MNGSELKRKIRETGATLKEVSDLLGITSQALNSIFNAKDVRSGTIERVAEVLQMPVSFFYGEANNGQNAVATGNKSVAAINSKVTSSSSDVLKERIKSLETLVTEKERLINVLMENKK